MQAKLNAKTGKDLSHLSGMTYLNALLFDRYKVLYKKVQNWVLAVVVILAALEDSLLLDPFTFTEAYLLNSYRFPS